METKPTNAVWNLARLVDRARQIPGTALLKDGWRQLLLIEPIDRSGLMAGIASAMVLCHDARTKVEQLDVTLRDHFLQPFPKIENAFTIFNLEANWTSVLSHLDETTLYAIQAAARVVTAAGLDDQSVIANADDNENLVQEVEGLARSIRDSDLPKLLKAYLLECLDRLQKALIRYKVFGNKDLKEALALIIGAPILDPNLLALVKEHKDAEHVSDFWLLWARLADTIAVAQIMLPSGVTALQLLLGNRS